MTGKKVDATVVTLAPAPLTSFLLPPESTRLLRRNLIAVGQIPSINGEIDAVWQPRPLVPTAGRQPRLFTHMRAYHGQTAAGAAPAAGALAQRMTGANIAGEAKVQQCPPHYAPGQFHAHRQRWFRVDHGFECPAAIAALAHRITPGIPKSQRKCGAAVESQACRNRFEQKIPTSIDQFA